MTTANGAAQRSYSGSQTEQDRGGAGPCAPNDGDWERGDWKKGDWEKGRVGAPGLNLTGAAPASGQAGRSVGRNTGRSAEKIRAAAQARADAETRYQADRKRADFAASLTAFAVGVPPEDLLHPTRLSATASFARQAAMYLCHVAFSMSLARVAQAFRRDRSTVAHACHRMEDRRDDNRFDEWMDALERSARHAHVELAGDLP